MHTVIIGNGIAAVSAASKIREADKDCGITMISDEGYTFYSRPRLIEYLSGKAGFEQIIIKKEQWYKDNSIKLLTDSKVTAVNTSEKQVSGDFGKISYDKLIIAAGASSFIPPFPGHDLKGVFALRTKEDADEIISAALGVKSAAVIGGGLLGIETAFALTARGLKVTVIEFFERLLPRQLDFEAAGLLQKFLEQKGINFLLSKQTDSVYGDFNGLKINFKDGGSEKACIIVVSAGVRPNVSFLKDSGLEINKGIKVNGKMETNIEDVYAAGDCAEFNGALYGIWPAAKEQGEAAGAAVTGAYVNYTGTVMSTKLKVAGIEVASAGDINIKDNTETKAKTDGAAFKKIFCENGIIKGGILIGNTSDYMKLQKLLAEKADCNQAANTLLL